MTFFNPPIEQDDMSILGLTSGEWRVRPLKDKVWARRLEVPYQGKIIIPESAKTPSVKVEILAIGPKVNEARVGQIALIGPYRDIEIENLVLFQEADIRVVFNA